MFIEPVCASGSWMGKVSPKGATGANENQRVSFTEAPKSCLITFPTWSVQKPRHNFLTYYIGGYTDTVRCKAVLNSLQTIDNLPITKPQRTYLCTHQSLCQFVHTSTEYQRASIQVACTQAPLQRWEDRCQKLWERSSDQERCAYSC